LGEEKLNVFSQVDLRIDKKWNLKRVAIDLYFEAQNALFEKIPQPDQYGLNRNADGSIIEPKQLVVIKEGSNSLIPVLGIVIDF